MLRGQRSFDCSPLDFISTGNVPCRHAGRLCLENELTFTLLIVRGDLFEYERGWRSDSCCHSSRPLTIELYTHRQLCGRYRRPKT